MNKNIRKSVYLGVFVFLSIIVASCEKDFTDIGSNVISNTKFETNSISIDIVAENSPLEKIQSDNISRQLGQYLLGVYNSPDYEKIEASIVSQLTMPSGLKLVENTYGADTTVVTKIDTVFLKIPYQVSFKDPADASSGYELDSIIGDASKPFNLNVYRSNTYINRFNPTDPSKINSFYSNDVFEKIGQPLNAQQNFPFTPNKNDTVLIVKRRLYNDVVHATDTLKLFASTANVVPIPFARIPLDKNEIKQLFLDQYETADFASQEAFNNYFRGIILEASGNEGSLASLNFNNTNNTTLIPSLEIYYTNTVLKGATTVVDTITKANSFALSGFRVNTFKNNDKVYPINNEIKIQGTAGSEADVTLLDQNTIDDLRSKDWLINDASITFYINQAADTTALPYRLYLYNTDGDLSNPSFSQVKDAVSEAQAGGIKGSLVRDANGKKEKYVFSVTDYVSDIVAGEINTVLKLKLKTFNTTDLPTSASDFVFRNYSWNPKAVTLFNNSPTNGTKKSTLKISYSKRK